MAARRYLRTKRPIPLDKALAAQAKEDIQRYQAQVDEYHNLLSIFRSVGDALAFIYLDKWDIKPMAFREDAGFISGKKGAYLERRILRDAFKSGRIAIMNDLTDSLRYGDVTLLTEQGVLLVEAKSTRRANRRTKRQEEALDTIEGYLATGYAKDLYRPGWQIQRRPLHKQERHRRRELNELIRDAYAGTRNHVQVEDGLFYYIETTQTSAILDHLTSFLSDIDGRCSETRLAFYLNLLKHDMVAYYPYVLSIEDPQALFDFYSGDLILLVLIDGEVMTKRLASEGLALSFHEDEEQSLVVDYLSPGNKEIGPMSISRHFFWRVPCEFLSLDWFLEEISQRAYSLWH